MMQGYEDEGPYEGQQAGHLEGEEVALKSMSLTPQSQVMKLKGEIGNREVIVLIDSGATHNFISPHLVHEEQLDFSNTNKFEVNLGTGSIHKGRGLCPNVELKLPDYEVKTDFLPLPMGEGDVILGMKWLQTLGTTKTNFKNLTMEFKDGKRKVRLHGDPTINNTNPSLNAIILGSEDLEDKVYLRGAGPDTSSKTQAKVQQQSKTISSTPGSKHAQKKCNLTQGLRESIRALNQPPKEVVHITKEASYYPLATAQQPTKNRQQVAQQNSPPPGLIVIGKSDFIEAQDQKEHREESIQHLVTASQPLFNKESGGLKHSKGITAPIEDKGNKCSVGYTLPCFTIKGAATPLI